MFWNGLVWWFWSDSVLIFWNCQGFEKEYNHSEKGELHVPANEKTWPGQDEERESGDHHAEEEDRWGKAGDVEEEGQQNISQEPTASSFSFEKTCQGFSLLSLQAEEIVWRREESGPRLYWLKGPLISDICEALVPGNEGPHSHQRKMLDLGTIA